MIRFRWVECQFDTLRKCITNNAVRKALKELPLTLDKTYDPILCSIPQDYHREAQCVMQLLAFSYRPLTLDEVAEAIAVNCDDECFDPEDRLPDQYDILEICSSLVTLAARGERYTKNPEIVIATSKSYDLHIILCRNIFFLHEFFWVVRQASVFPRNSRIR